MTTVCVDPDQFTVDAAGRLQLRTGCGLHTVPGQGVVARIAQSRILNFTDSNFNNPGLAGGEVCWTASTEVDLRDWCDGDVGFDLNLNGYWQTNSNAGSSGYRVVLRLEVYQDGAAYTGGFDELVHMSSADPAGPRGGRSTVPTAFVAPTGHVYTLRATLCMSLTQAGGVAIDVRQLRIAGRIGHVWE